MTNSPSQILRQGSGSYITGYINIHGVSWKETQREQWMENFSYQNQVPPTPLPASSTLVRKPYCRILYVE